VLQQRREFSLDLDDLAGRVEIAREPALLLLEPGDLLVAWIGRLAAGVAAERLFGAVISLAAPLGDERAVEALTAQQRALLRFRQRLVLGENPRLV